MFIPYYTIGKDFEVVVSEWKGDHTVAHFEKPSAKYCFKTLDCTVPFYRTSEIFGFTEKEVTKLVEFCKRHEEIMIEVSKAGGWGNLID